MSDGSLLEFVKDGLERHKGDWPQIADETGVPYDTLAKIARGVIGDPGVRKVEKLAANLKLRDTQQAARQEATT